MEMTLNNGFIEMSQEEMGVIDGGDAVRDTLIGVAGAAVGMAVGFAVGGPVGAAVGGKNGAAIGTLVGTGVGAVADWATQKVINGLIDN